MLKFLIIVMAVFFLLRLIGRYFVISTFSHFNKRMQDQFNNQANRNPASRPEGEVTINPGQNNKTRHDAGAGEYVDYEEVK